MPPPFNAEWDFKSLCWERVDESFIGSAVLVKNAFESKEQLCLVWYIFSYKLCSIFCFPTHHVFISFCLCYVAPVIRAG